MKGRGSIFGRSSEHTAGRCGARVTVHHWRRQASKRSAPSRAWAPQIALGPQGTRREHLQKQRGPSEWDQFSTGCGHDGLGECQHQESRDQARPAPSPWTLMPREAVFIMGRSMESLIVPILAFPSSVTLGCSFLICNTRILIIFNSGFVESIK